MNWELFVVGWLALSGLAVFVRGIAGSVREYTEFDSFFGAAEVAFLIWIVVTKL